MTSRAAHRDRGQEGFTLIELLIAVAVMSILLPALGAAFFTTFRTLEGTSDRVGSSAGAVLAATFFSTDVQSATSVSGASGAQSCSIASPTGQIIFTTIRTGARATWYRDGATLGRVACDAGGTVTATSMVALQEATNPAAFCGMSPCPVDISSPSAVSLTFHPREGNEVRLSAARRNP